MIPGGTCGTIEQPMTDFAVSPEKNTWLKERMAALDIQEKDLEEHFIRSSGKGGQKVNKTASCVYLKHLPTGTEVKCMKERSQSVNRFLARRMIAEKIELLLKGKDSATEQMHDKLRKQKNKRKKRTRLKNINISTAMTDGPIADIE